MVVDDLFLNGEFMPLASGTVSVLDRGFQFGDGAYEVVRFRGERFLWLDEHMERLRRSLAALAMPSADVAARLAANLPELASRSGYPEGSAYLQVTRGAAPRDFALPSEPVLTELAYVRPHTFLSWEEVNAGTTALLQEDMRWARCDVKSVSLLAAVMGKAVAAAAGTAEVIWVGTDGSVREGGSCNIFAVVDGELRTHPTDRHVLDGITRRRVLELAHGAGIAVREDPVTRDELSQADEVFLSSTMRDVLPILRIDDLPVGDGRPGLVTLRIAEMLRAAVTVELAVP